RESASIIEQQQKNVKGSNAEALTAMHQLKKQAVMMKEALLRGEIDRIGEILHFGWENKKRMALGISNSQIDWLYEKALQSGATGGKISGAGGGGFMVFYCPGQTRHAVKKSLEALGAVHQPYQFSKEGL